MSGAELLEAAHEEAWRLAIAGQTPRSKALFAYRDGDYDGANPAFEQACGAADMVHFLETLIRTGAKRRVVFVSDMKAGDKIQNWPFGEDECDVIDVEDMPSGNSRVSFIRCGQVCSHEMYPDLKATILRSATGDER